MTDPCDEAELDRISELLSRTTPEAEASRRRLGLGVGLDEDGRLVYARDLLAERGPSSAHVQRPAHRSVRDPRKPARRRAGGAAGA